MNNSFTNKYVLMFTFIANYYFKITTTKQLTNTLTQTEKQKVY